MQILPEASRIYLYRFWAVAFAAVHPARAGGYDGNHGSNVCTRNDEFAILDLIASCEFRTVSSISFSLGKYSDHRLVPEDATPGSDNTRTIDIGRVFKVIGWVDVHHPCYGHIKTQLRVRLPAEYQISGKTMAIIDALFFALDIPPDETYEAQFFSVAESDCVCLEQATDRDGCTDRT